MDNHFYLIDRFKRLSAAAGTAAAQSNDEDVRSTFTLLADRWRSLAEMLTPNHSIWRRGARNASASDLPDGIRNYGDGKVGPASGQGITSVSAITYRYKTFKYTNLDDAIAQMERDLPICGLPNPSAPPLTTKDSVQGNHGAQPASPQSSSEWT